MPICICRGPVLVLLNVILCSSTLRGATSGSGPSYSGPIVTADRHDGGLRWAVGVQEHALFRATRNTAYSQNADGTAGATFNHAMTLAYWQGRFWCSYQGAPSEVYEQGPQAAVPVYLSMSSDGSAWSKSVVLFPAPTINGIKSYASQRNGYHISSKGELLAFTFMGGRDPNDGCGGFARLVREIAGPTTFGMVYAVRYNSGFSAANTPWNPYSNSSSSAFKIAVKEALNDALWREDWNEEDSNKDLYLFPGSSKAAFPGKAFSWYRLPDHRIVGMWKGNWMTVSKGSDWIEGQVPKPIKDNSRFPKLYSSAKQWCEQEPNSINYDMFFSLDVKGARTPLVVLTSADGLHFEKDWLVISGDIHQEFYANPMSTGVIDDNKNGGPQYVRGLEAWDKRPSNDSIWLTYSQSKEDVWVAEVPTPVTGTVSSDVNDTFDSMAVGGRVVNWNIRDSGWCRVRIVNLGNSHKALRLTDQDPYDYAKAFRIFPESSKATITLELTAHQKNTGMLEVALVDKAGLQPATLRFDHDGKLKAWFRGTWNQVGLYDSDSPIAVELSIDCIGGTWSAKMDGASIVARAPLSQAVGSVERIELRTGPYRQANWTRIPGDYPTTSLTDADNPITEAIFDITRVTTQGVRTASAMTPSVAPSRNAAPDDGLPSTDTERP